jgi:hypothetical protein
VGRVVLGGDSLWWKGSRGWAVRERRGDGEKEESGSWNNLRPSVKQGLIVCDVFTIALGEDKGFEQQAMEE